MEQIIPLRQQLRALEAELDELLPSDDSPSASLQSYYRVEPKISEYRPSDLSGMDRDLEPRGALTQAIRYLLSSDPTRAFTPRQVIQAIGVSDERTNSVYSALSRMAKLGEVDRDDETNTYRLAQLES
ncbi:MAG TPA: hypothetical protein VF618_03665 [Thermoanaerobaculia bacterium]